MIFGFSACQAASYMNLHCQCRSVPEAAHMLRVYTRPRACPYLPDDFGRLPVRESPPPSDGFRVGYIGYTVLSRLGFWFWCGFRRSCGLGRGIVDLRLMAK